MNRARMILTLAVLFIVSLFLIGFGDWLWVLTNYAYPYTHAGFPTVSIVQPYQTLRFVLVGCGVLVLTFVLGLLFDWYHLLIQHPHAPAVQKTQKC